MAFFCARRGKERMLGVMSPGEWGTVDRIEAEGTVKGRVLRMGLVPGTWVRVEKKSLGDCSVEVLFRGSRAVLSREEAQSVMISPPGCSGCGGGCG